jgi:cellulose synthase/poly-beta-1,6-N-acetylglucosamine synthase-like glycosyltransferase
MIDTCNTLLSVVVIGRNEGARLGQCLESVLTMNIPPESVQQLIYVDSSSTDNSVGVAESHGAVTVVVNAKRPCAAKARNAGWRTAASQFVMFLDGDTILDPDFVGRALASFNDPAVAVVYGKRREIFPEQSIYTRVLDLDWASSSPPGESKYCGGDAIFRRSVLEETGGFDDELIAGEEPELCWRIRALGRKVIMLDIPMTGHDLAITRWRQYWKRSVRTGYAYAEIAERFRQTTDPLWRAEQVRNVIQGAGYSILMLCGLGFGLLNWSLWPPVLAFGALTILALRTGLLNRRRSSSPGLLIAYGVHSHLQQIPVFVGQIQYWLGRFRGRGRTLIEYRKSTP